MLSTIFQPGVAAALEALAAAPPDSPAQDIASAPLLASAPGGGLTATVGDGQADDAPALNGSLAAVRGTGRPVMIGSGLFNAGEPLLLGGFDGYDQANPTNPGIQPGFILRGTGAASIQPFTSTGNMIRASAPGRDILQVGPARCIQSLIEGVTLDGGDEALGTPCGIHTLYNYWSGLSLTNVRINPNVDTAVWIDGALGGVNGEFFNAYNCDFSARKVIYRNSSPRGQAVVHTLTACHGGTENGGTQFQIDTSTQLNVFGWSCTQYAGPEANTFLRLTGCLYQRLVFVGGRCENTHCLVDWVGESSFQNGGAAWEDIDFDGMLPGVPLFSGGGTNCSYRFVFNRCGFGVDGPPGPMAVNILPGGDERIRFKDCDFAGWDDYTQLTTNPHITLLGCRFFGADNQWHPLTQPATQAASAA